MSANIETLTDQNWATEVLASDKPVLVDFWAEWCAPCKAMVPDLEAVAAQYAGRVRVGKLNVEENDKVPFDYGITAMPTLLVLKGGKVAEQRVGKMSREQLAQAARQPPVAAVRLAAERPAVVIPRRSRHDGREGSAVAPRPRTVAIAPRRVPRALSSRGAPVMTGAEGSRSRAAACRVSSGHRLRGGCRAPPVPGTTSDSSR